MQLKTPSAYGAHPIPRKPHGGETWQGQLSGGGDIFPQDVCPIPVLEQVVVLVLYCVCVPVNLFTC
jgi:hypothetical protein